MAQVVARNPRVVLDELRQITANRLPDEVIDITVAGFDDLIGGLEILIETVGKLQAALKAR